MPRSTSSYFFQGPGTPTAHQEAVHKRKSYQFGECVREHSLPLFGEIPLRVITKRQNESNDIEQAWQDHQAILAQRSSNSIQTVCPEGVGHNIPEEAPQVVVQEILSLRKHD